MKKTITCALIAITALTASAADSFIIDIDDASHVKFETGPYASAYKEVVLQNGENTITVNGSDDYRFTPAEGWLIESITGFDETGTQTAESPAGWNFDKDTDSYTIWFGSKKPAYKYVVRTKENVPLIYTLNLDINDSSAISKGTFRAGNQTVTAVDGPQTVEFNANKGVGFLIQLRPAVIDVSFMRNGIAMDPDNILADGSRIYSFDLTENENIDIDVTMEVPEFFIELDDPDHVDILFPDDKTILTGLEAGRNRLTYAPGDELSIVAKEGYRIIGFENMDFNLTTDTYSWRFKDGHSGTEFKAVTEEYLPPIARININVDDPKFLSFVKPEGSPTIYTLTEGDNEVKINLDKGSRLTLSFKTSFKDMFLVAADNVVLDLVDDWYNLTAEVEYGDAGEYEVMVRTAMEGAYNGEISYSPSSDYKTWTLSFDPAGIIEKADDSMPSISRASGEAIIAESVEVTGNSATIVFTESPVCGENTLAVPEALFRINGASSPEILHKFMSVEAGVNGITQDKEYDVRYLDLHGFEISHPEAGQPVIVVKNGKHTKTIFMK